MAHGKGHPKSCRCGFCTKSSQYTKKPKKSRGRRGGKRR